MRTFWIVATLALFVLAALAFALINAPQFRIRSIDVRAPAAPGITHATVIAAAQIDSATNIWLLDKRSVQQRIEALAYVDAARISRTQFPQPTVVIEVTARTPAACVRAAGAAVTIDATARVLAARCSSDALPSIDLEGSRRLGAPGSTVADPDARALVALAATIAPRLAMRAIRRDHFDGIEVVDRLGVVVRLGTAEDLDKKLALVEPVRRSVGLGRRLRAIDLRTPGTPTVEFP